MHSCEVRRSCTCKRLGILQCELWMLCATVPRPGIEYLAACSACAADAGVMTQLGQLAILVFQPVVLQPLPPPDQVRKWCYLRLCGACLLGQCFCCHPAQFLMTDP